MPQFFDPIITTLVLFFPEDYLLPARFFIAKAVIISFLCGWIMSYPVNFIVKRLGLKIRGRWKEKRREQRMASVKVPNGEFIGEVTSYLSKLKVAIILIRRKKLKQGETILIKGKKTKLMLPVKSMQINRKPVAVAAKGNEIGLLIGKEVNRHDLVFKMRG